MFPDTQQQRIFIVGDDSLFEEGVTRLLTHQTNFLVSNTAYSDNLEFLDSVQQDPPDVILVVEVGEPNARRILDQVSSHPVVGGLTVVVVRIEDNVIDIYESPTSDAGRTSYASRRMIARSEEDLINAVRRNHNA